MGLFDRRNRFDRRNFLAATGVTALAGSLGLRRGGSGTAVARTWEHVSERAEFSTFVRPMRTDDGYLLVGSTRDESFYTSGLVQKVSPDGALEWEQEYVSQDQADLRGEDVQGPVPEDWLSFSLERDGGALLVGWTYYDNTAVNVARLWAVDETGSVDAETSLGNLDDASAYSYLTDGVRTDDGYLLCGIESPGIMLGGAGWLVSVDENGAVNWHERYPATERDLEETFRRDVFNGIASTDGGYVLGGSYEPEDEDARGWILGIDDDGSIRWEDRFDLTHDGPTVIYDVEPSDADAYDLLVVGSYGEFVSRGGQQLPHTPETVGHGFVAAYTDDGELVWQNEIENTALLCATIGPAGVVAGGARSDRGWVGTPARTDFEADRRGAVAGLCQGHDDGTLLATGRLVDDGNVDAWATIVESPSDG